MSGDSERDAPYQHPTEREDFEEWWDKAVNDPNFGGRGEWMAWQAGRAPLLKRIEELEEMHNNWVHSDIDREQENLQLNAKVAMMREALQLGLNAAEKNWCIDWNELEQAISTTEQDVTRWVNGVKADALEDACAGMAYMQDIESLMDMVKQLRGEQV